MTVVTVVVFSGTLTDAVVPPPLLVIIGASLTLVTVIVNAFSKNSPPWSVVRTRIE